MEHLLIQIGNKILGGSTIPVARKSNFEARVLYFNRAPLHYLPAICCCILADLGFNDFLLCLPVASQCHSRHHPSVDRLFWGPFREFHQIIAAISARFAENY